MHAHTHRRQAHITSHTCTPPHTHGGRERERERCRWGQRYRNEAQNTYTHKYRCTYSQTGRYVSYTIQKYTLSHIHIHTGIHNAAIQVYTQIHTLEHAHRNTVWACFERNYTHRPLCYIFLIKYCLKWINYDQENFNYCLSKIHWYFPFY